MTDRLAPASAAATRTPFGTFRFRPATNELIWSEELFGIFGFEVGDVVPTLALMASHQQPDNRADWDQAVAEILLDGKAFSKWHRIIDARTRVRTLQTSVDALVDGKTILELRGVVADLTERLRQDRDEEVKVAVLRSNETRAVIDQAKGILMATMDVDETQAFELLRWHSSYANIKLRDIAAMLLAKLAEPDTAGSLPRQRLTTVLAELAGPRRSPPVTERPQGWTTTPEPPAEQEAAVSSRIPSTSMAATLVRAVEAAGVSITIADCLAKDWPLVYVNAAFERLTGYTEAEMVGRNCRFLQGVASDRKQSAAVRAALIAGEEIRTVLLNYRKDGTAFFNELHLSAVRDSTGTLTHYIGYQSDVSERVEREHQLEHLAYHDAATGLPNRAAAVRYLESAMLDGAALTVLHLRLSGHRREGRSSDADRLREVMTAASERLTAVFPTSTFLAVLDEDSFLAVVSGRNRIGDTARAAFTEPIVVDDDELLVSVTIGEAGDPVDADGPQELIEAARSRSAPQAVG